MMLLHINTPANDPLHTHCEDVTVDMSDPEARAWWTANARSYQAWTNGTVCDPTAYPVAEHRAQPVTAQGITLRRMRTSSMVEASASQNVSQLLEEIIQTMKIVPSAILSSRSIDGADISSRVMSPKPPLPSNDPKEALREILIDTNIFSRKVKELAAAPRANLIYYDDAGDGYVSLKGSTSLCIHPEAVAQYWDGWDPFYPNGSSTANYAVLKFLPDQIEFVSTFRFKVGAGRSDWLPPTLVRKQGSWVEQVPATPPPPPPGTRWVCTVCSHVYDADKDGAGVAFEHLPESWKCPICGKPKSFYIKQTLRDGTVQW